MALKDKFFPLYVGDYARDTFHLTTEEHGAYLLLLMASWSQNGRLSDDKKELAAITKTSPEKWRTLAPKMRAFFVVENGEWIHPRVAKEAEKAENQMLKKSEAGKKGAASRWQNDASAIRIPLAKRCNRHRPSPSPSPSPIDQDQSQTHIGHRNDDRSVPSKPASKYSESFEKHFWSIYPRKAGKRAAWGAWQRIKKSGGVTVGEISDALKSNLEKNPEWKRGIIPNPLTWLNQGRWEDDLSTIPDGTRRALRPRSGAGEVNYSEGIDGEGKFK